MLNPLGLSGEPASLLVVTSSNGSLGLLEPGKKGSLILRVLFWGRRGKVSPIGFCCAWKSPRRDESGQAGSILQADDRQLSRTEAGWAERLSLILATWQCSPPIITARCIVQRSALHRPSQCAASVIAARCIRHRSAVGLSSRNIEQASSHSRASHCCT